MDKLQTSTEIKIEGKKRWWKRCNWEAFRKALIVVLGLWIVFSISYIVRDQWLKFQFRQIQASYQKGIADTIRTVMNQVELCQPLSLVDEDKKIEIIKVGCEKKQPVEQPAGE